MLSEATNGEARRDSPVDGPDLCSVLRASGLEIIARK